MRWFPRRHRLAARAAGPARTARAERSDRDHSGVYLGFADGSLLELAASDPRAGTFRAVAAALTQGHR